METASLPAHEPNTLFIIPRRTIIQWVCRDILLRDLARLRREIVAQALLTLDQAAVHAALEPHQGGVFAVLDDTTVVEDQDPVELPHRRQPMRDDQCRAALHQAAHG